MDLWIQPLIIWVSANPTLTGVVIFFIAFLESVAVIGILVPGSTMMLVAGGLIGAGEIDFWPVFFWAIAGAVLGDGLSFWLGHHFQHQLRTLWPFSKYPHMLEEGDRFFASYGGYSVFIGRFFGPVRAIIPVIAGIMRMEVKAFIIANVLSAIGWAGLSLIPTWLFGISIKAQSEMTKWIFLAALFTSVLIFFIIWLRQKRLASKE